MFNGLKIGVLVPTRGKERLEFVTNAIRLLSLQTVAPDVVEVIGEDPQSDACDITYRYRKGYNKLSHCDLIFFWEDDDWYAPDYIEEMLREWNSAGRPDLFGTRFTMYYNLRIKKYFKMQHEQRASAMNTLIKSNLKFNWGKDSDPFTDAWLWMTGQPLSKALYTPTTVKSIGIKHGIGLTGGSGHVENLQRYINDDNEDMYWLKWIVDEESYHFYCKVSHQLQLKHNDPSDVDHLEDMRKAMHGGVNE